MSSRDEERLRRKKERESKERLVKIGIAIAGLGLIGFVATRPAVVLDDGPSEEQIALELEEQRGKFLAEIERLDGLLAGELEESERKRLEAQVADLRSSLEQLGD